MASADEEQVDLVPEWLAKGNNLHSPGPHVPLGGLRDSRHARGGSNSSRGLATPDSTNLHQLHHSSSTPHGISSLLVARSDERPAGWSPRSHTHHHNGAAQHGSRRSSYEERHQITSPPFSPGANGNCSNSNLFWPHKGSAVGTSASTSMRHAAASGRNSAVTYHAGQRFGLQRTLSEGSGRHSAAPGSDNHPKDNSAHHSRRGGAPEAAALHKLDPAEYPYVGTTTSSSSSSSPHSSSGKQTSQDAYAPSLAPYKQGFLDSLGSASWTSKLADVPSAAAAGAGTQPDTKVHGHSRSSTAGVPAAASTSTSTVSGTQGGEPGAAQAASASAAATVQAGVDGSIPGNSNSSAHGAVPAQHQPSLADTLKQAAAASGGGHGSAGQQLDAQRRHSKTLVPLLPGCKGKHGGSTVRTAPAPMATRLTAANCPRSAAAEVQLASAHAPLLTLSHSNHSGTHSSNVAGSCLQHEVGVQCSTATEGPVLSAGSVLAPQQSLAAPTLHGLQPASRAAGSQTCQLTGGVGAASAAEQRQQLQDRNSFFAVLRRKTSSSSSCSGTGEQNGNDKGVALSSACSSGGSGGGGLHTQQSSEAAAVQPVDKKGACCNAATPGSPEPEAAPAATPVGLATAVGLGIQCKQEQALQQGQQQTVNCCQDQADVSHDSSTVMTVKQHNIGAPCDRAVSSYPISASSSQNEEHCEVHSCCSPQQENSRSNGMLWDVTAAEEAFLRSLGWTAEASDDESDWGLTDEEIAAFQVEAAARAATQQEVRRQQQDRYTRDSLLQLQQKAELIGGYQSRSNNNAVKRSLACGNSTVRATHGLWGDYENSSRYLRAEGLGIQAGLLLGMSAAPAAASLEFGGCDGSSSSTSSDEDNF